MFRKKGNGVIGNVTIGLQMGITIFLFVYGGYRLDRYLDLFPLFLVVGTILGMSTSFYYLFKDLKEQERRESEGNSENGDRAKWM